MREPTDKPRVFHVDLDFAGRQSTGSRDEQQDAYAFSVVEGDAAAGAARLLLVLADGMGGHAGGREASCAAVQGFVDAFFEQIAGTNPADRFRSCLLAANKTVDTLIRSDEERLGEAGTTLLALECTGKGIHWISVGDSPLFLWREKKLSRLNEDHSMRSVLAKKVAEKQMAPGDVDSHPERNVLLSALNGLDPEKIDNPQEPFAALPGDLFLAASDGILSLLEADVVQVLKKGEGKPAAVLATSLLAAVEKKQLPKQDNTTVAVIKL